MNGYCTDALAYLKLAFDGERALFSYASTLDSDGRLVNDWRMPESLRYTINTYLGLSEVERHDGPIEWLGDVKARVGEFLEQHEHALNRPADHGLLLVLLATVDPSHPAVGRSLERIAATVAGDDAIRRLNMQDLAWMLWGASTWVDDPRAPALPHRLFGLTRTHFVHPTTGLPRHSAARYRAHTVSFGSVVYFLRAMHEYAEAFDSGPARELFSSAVKRVLTIQADDGGWPWMIDVRTGIPFDLYPIFTVHQDSMAMLFLFPAERYGLAGVEEAIARSLAWNFGHNELNLSLPRGEPCAWFDRSIERAELYPRLRRYLRGLGRPARSYPQHSANVRINRECRSYHLGWVLYTWSARSSMPVPGVPAAAR